MHFILFLLFLSIQSEKIKIINQKIGIEGDDRPHKEIREVQPLDSTIAKICITVARFNINPSNLKKYMITQYFE